MSHDELKYRDIRAELWRRSFDEAVDYETYLTTSSPRRAEHWAEMMAKMPPLTDDQTRRLRGYGCQINVLFLSSDWCGDCVRQGPMVTRIADACETAELRLIDRDVNPTLRDELRIMGAMRVPVAIFLTEEFFEIGRSSDRTLGRYRQKAATEMGAACPVPWVAPAEGELAAEQGEWVDLFERMLLMVRLRPT